jgi:hypothetical protein
MGSESNEIVDGVPAPVELLSSELISDRYVAGTDGPCKGQVGYSVRSGSKVER